MFMNIIEIMRNDRLSAAQLGVGAGTTHYCKEKLVKRLFTDRFHTH